MIRLNQVSKSYFGQTRVLEQIELELKKGDFLYVVGGSGAGKSSLLRLLATEEAPTSGEVALFGFALSRVSPSALRSIRQSLGYVPQDTRLIQDLSVHDNVALSLSLAGKRGLSAQAREKVREMLVLLGLEAKRDKLAGALSGGEAQRVALARALVREPQLLVADEPTGAQDRDYTWTMMDLIMKANAKGTTVVLATHDREIVRRVRRRCAMLKDGRIMIDEGVCIY
ncbi:MAG: cell division ATP-binding protein FtsE [Bdellovibrionota bacterium]